MGTVVVVVDPRRLFREGVVGLLASQAGVQVAGSAACLADLESTYDVIVAGGGALAATERMVQYTDDDDVTTVLEAIRLVCGEQGDAHRGFVAPASVKQRSPLTRRESEVLRSIALGRSAQEIAAALELSVRTVNGHKRNILTKLGAQNQAEALSKAIAGRMIDLERD